MPGCCPIDHYTIVWQTAYADTYAQSDVGNVTTATLPVKPATQYNYWVVAHDTQGGESTYTRTYTTVTPFSDSGPDLIPPSAPVLQSSGEGPNGVGLSWSASTDNVAVVAYDVYWFDGVFNTKVTASVTGTSYTAPALSSSYDYFVRARDAAGNISISSNKVKAGDNPNGPRPQVSENPSPTASPVPPKPSCTAAYHVDSEWQGGYVSNVTVTNTGSVAISGWEIKFAFAGGQKITQSWNGGFTQVGTAVVLSNIDWNTTIVPGGKVSVGLYGSWTGSNPPPQSFQLNDSPCTRG